MKKLKFLNKMNEQQASRLRLRDRIITGTYAIGAIGKEPTDWKGYALKLESHISKLESVMIAAAEEIQEHWSAHCDEEGYGPSNLMHRLENGIAANYSGYSFGQFTKLQKELDALRAGVSNSEVFEHYGKPFTNGRDLWDFLTAHYNFTPKT